MTDQFDYFVVFAEMRTGSNFLETNLNAFQDIECHGEAFNPAFIGYPQATDILGVSQAEREANPKKLIRTIRDKSNGLGGFRYFHDHDPRVLDIVLDDPRCAKVVLTRNPVDSYVSWKIATATGQWKLTNVKQRKDSKIVFDADEFQAHVAALQDFQITLMNRLQAAGQTAFYVAYEDLQSVEVMNGLARYLGSSHPLEALDKTLKRQNPSTLEEKVANFDDLTGALAKLDRFNLTRTPNFEPRRGAAVPGYVACAESPLMFLPIRGGPDEEIREWMAALDGVHTDALLSGFNQKSLRKWKAARPGHRSFAVLRHPLARAHAAFCRRILVPGPECFPLIRKQLVRFHNMKVPDSFPDADYDRIAHRAAFASYLHFARANLNGQTGARTDAAWATQAAILQGYAEFALPDMILREEELAAFLPAITMQIGRDTDHDLSRPADDQPFTLADIYDDELEQMAREAWPRDYVMFGFGDWQPLP